METGCGVLLWTGNLDRGKLVQLKLDNSSESPAVQPPVRVIAQTQTLSAFVLLIDTHLYTYFEERFGLKAER